ncbi:MAG: hypothetical protein CMG69_00250 [Candidatus Marinimicrobia bacterium]|nr:hypothetical protein [Candidatus Neomarinimicrobiota bacterium]|tara:strand:- start:18021 stop:18206 length:186 start_codon:yes stop_codon:yes gene_type:complete
MNRIFSHTWLITIILFSLLITGCEDDPIISPQTGDADDGGSYGNLSFPGSDNNDVNNPETF